MHLCTYVCVCGGGWFTNEIMDRFSFQHKWSLRVHTCTHTRAYTHKYTISMLSAAVLIAYVYLSIHIHIHITAHQLVHVMKPTITVPSFAGWNRGSARSCWCIGERERCTCETTRWFARQTCQGSGRNRGIEGYSGTYGPKVCGNVCVCVCECMCTCMYVNVYLCV
jgi:hypothetical protein